MTGLTATDLTDLGSFLAKLEEASKQTGVKVTHYDRINLTTGSGIEVTMRGSQTTEGYYVIEESSVQ